MERYCSKGQSSQRAVAPTEDDVFNTACSNPVWGGAQKAHGAHNKVIMLPFH
jgi:hypothetical protein